MIMEEIMSHRLVKKFHCIQEVEEFIRSDFFFLFFENSILIEASEITRKEVGTSIEKLNKPAVLVINKKENEYKMTFINTTTQVEKTLVSA